MPTVRGLIPLEGVAQTKIVFDDGRIVFLNVVSKNENGMRVIDVRTTFSIANCTDLNLECSPATFLTIEQLASDLNANRFEIENLKRLHYDLFQYTWQ